MGKTWKNNLNKDNIFSQFCIFSLGHKNWMQKSLNSSQIISNTSFVSCKQEKFNLLLGLTWIPMNSQFCFQIIHLHSVLYLIIVIFLKIYLGYSWYLEFLELVFCHDNYLFSSICPYNFESSLSNIRISTVYLFIFGSGANGPWNQRLWSCHTVVYSFYLCGFIYFLWYVVRLSF